jgi:ABC-type multidrug transport system fused ATPase/permease subunit
MFIAMLFNPLRQIADKFNEMQLGMIAANRFFIIDTADQIQDTGTVEAPIFHGNLHFKDVHFSYIPDEEVIKESSMQEKQSRSWVLQVLENLLLSIC